MNKQLAPSLQLSRSTEVASDFLGAGWAFPIATDAHGRIALSRRERNVEEAIQIILLTPQGQRRMRPTFGCRIHELMFAPNDAATASLAAYYVREALEMWEPRIELEQVTAAPDAAHGERLLITIGYRIKATLDRRTLVYPFYRIPEE